jgi:hypothetical protein
LPGSAVGRRTRVVVIPAILSPLPDIAKHVVEAELVWRETANRRRESKSVAALSIYAALTRMCPTEVPIGMIDVTAELRGSITAVTRRCCSRPRGVFPLSLRR